MEPEPPVACLFTTKGEIIRFFIEGATKGDELKPSILGKEYADQPSMYLYGLPDHYFLFMHEDNDFIDNYEASSLEVNTAIQKYFPNCPFKGNLLLVKIDEEDNLQGGTWWSSVLRNYVLGYRKNENADINMPTIVSKEEAEDYNLVDYQTHSSKKKKPSKETQEICVLCGEPKEFLHSRDCALRCTKKIVERITAIRKANPKLDKKIKAQSISALEYKKCSWSELTSFKFLLQKGFDSVGIEWCNFYLDLFGDLKTEVEKEVLLEGLISVAFCFDINSGHLDYFEKCPYCKKVFDECTKQRHGTWGIIKNCIEKIGYPYFEELDSVVKNLPHLTLNVYIQFFHQPEETLSGEKKEIAKPLVCAMIFSWSNLVLHTGLNRILAEADANLGW